MKRPLNYPISWLYSLLALLFLLGCKTDHQGQQTEAKDKGHLPEDHFMGKEEEQKGHRIKRNNILLICVDDLRPDLLSYGAGHMQTPHMDALAQSGFSFLNHFVNAPSCGPSRYTLLTGQYGPPSNNALFQRAQALEKGEKKVEPSMPEWFRSHGFTTVSVGKVSHHPGGRGGSNWNDSTFIEMPGAWDRHLMPVAEWEHPRGAMHGLARGEIRENAQDMSVYQTVNGPDSLYPDGHITKVAMDQLTLLSKEGKPFFLAVGLLKPHLPFGAPQAYYEPYDSITLPPIPHPKKPTGKTTWHDSGEFKQYNLWGRDPNEDAVFAEEVRKHYAACVTYADAQVGRILTALKESGAADNTIVVLWGDHGWHLGEHGIWGKHSLFDESLKSPLIIKYPEMPTTNKKTTALAATLDIFPTLCDISGVDIPQFVQGSSLRPMMQDQKEGVGHAVFSYTAKACTLRTTTHRFILHTDGHVELYDHTAPEKETLNIAMDHPQLVTSLTQRVLEKCNDRHAHL